MTDKMAVDGPLKPVAKQHTGDDSPATGAPGASAERKHRDDASDPGREKTTRRDGEPTTLLYADHGH